ncbi:hypothetical protein RHABOEDO_001894 (plasmid) [Candidatus Rhabdochlamydia oedothoracis]|uniref:Uncharacterized protein n=1 Tax=Candidatus Rhabdochlamydia oedothoracis TaxID=2720720 RepID=A0ABX8V2W9_9BACT|nr:hypothetical protein RHOW815_001281 [Candidatus Rhabdochlamydia sp. W815]QYF49496.1 hypothetical protein RHABOEDO_001894 [Candidatus Rhabdochlamydia oedothoracis]
MASFLHSLAFAEGLFSHELITYILKHLKIDTVHWGIPSLIILKTARFLR